MTRLIVATFPIGRTEPINAYGMNFPSEVSENLFSVSKIVHRYSDSDALWFGAKSFTVTHAPLGNSLVVDVTDENYVHEIRTPSFTPNNYDFIYPGIYNMFGLNSDDWCVFPSTDKSYELHMINVAKCFTDIYNNRIVSFNVGETYRCKLVSDYGGVNDIEFASLVNGSYTIPVTIGDNPEWRSVGVEITIPPNTPPGIYTITGNTYYRRNYDFTYSDYTFASVTFEYPTVEILDIPQKNLTMGDTLSFNLISTVDVSTAASVTLFHTGNGACSLGSSSITVSDSNHINDITFTPGPSTYLGEYYMWIMDPDHVALESIPIERNSVIIHAKPKARINITEGINEYFTAGKTIYVELWGVAGMDKIQSVRLTHEGGYHSFLNTSIEYIDSTCTRVSFDISDDATIGVYNVVLYSKDEMAAFGLGTHNQCTMDGGTMTLVNTFRKTIAVDYPKLVADVTGDFKLGRDGKYISDEDGIFTLTAQQGVIVRMDISGDVENTIYVNNDTFTIDTSTFADWRNCTISVLVSDRDTGFEDPTGAYVIFQCVYDNCTCTVSAPSYTVTGSTILKKVAAGGETLPTITFTNTKSENITRIEKYDTSTSTLLSTAFPDVNPYVYSPGTQAPITRNKNYKLKVIGNGAGYSQYNVILTISGNAVDGAGNYKGSVSVNGTKYTASTTLSYNVGVSSAFTIMCTGGMNITSVTKDGATQTLANPTTCFVTLNATTATTIRLNVTFDGNTGTSHVITSKVAPGYEKDFTIYPNGSSTVTHGGNSEPYYLSTSMESPSYTVWIDSVRQYLANPASYTFTNVTSNHNIVIAPWTWSPIKCVR